MVRTESNLGSDRKHTSLNTTEQQNFEVTKTARYFKTGGTESVERLYVCTHGYAMNAKYFIKKLESLGNETTAVIAPEGLNRFYIQGSGGRVGASWMTKEDRLIDIADNIKYLEECVRHAGASRNTKITAFGFSQGFHTLIRWAVKSRFNIERVTAWGSHFPDDVLTEENKSFLSGKQIDIVLGEEDEYVTKEKLNVHLHELKKYGISPRLTTYAGTHKIYPEVLNRLYKNE